MAEQTLGDILGAVLAEAQPSHEPPALVAEDQAAIDRLVADILADGPISPGTPFNPIDLMMATVIAEVEQERRQEEHVASVAMVSSGRCLASELAPLVNATADEVFNVLGTVPDNMLELLKSPQGWSTLAGYVAGDLGRALPDYKPTIH